MSTAERRPSPGAGFALAVVLSTVLWVLFLVSAVVWLLRPSPVEAAEWYRSLQPLCREFGGEPISEPTFVRNAEETIVGPCTVAVRGGAALYLVNSHVGTDYRGGEARANVAVELAGGHLRMLRSSLAAGSFAGVSVTGTGSVWLTGSSLHGDYGAGINVRGDVTLKRSGISSGPRSSTAAVANGGTLYVVDSSVTSPKSGGGLGASEAIVAMRTRLGLSGSLSVGQGGDLVAVGVEASWISLRVTGVEDGNRPELGEVILVGNRFDHSLRVPKGLMAENCLAVDNEPHIECPTAAP